MSCLDKCVVFCKWQIKVMRVTVSTFNRQMSDWVDWVDWVARWVGKVFEVFL